MIEHLKSCKVHRDCQRINGGIEILSRSLSLINPVVQIPPKIAQSVVCAHSLFRPETSTFEKSLAAAQLLLCFTQAALLAAILLMSIDCGITTFILCTATTVCELVYDGLLLSGWATAELLKKEYLGNGRNSQLV